MPYDGWGEVVVNLQGNDYPDLSIRVTFLVSRLELDRPLIGLNVFQIKNNESRPMLMSILSALVAGAMEVDGSSVEMMVNFIQTQKAPGEEHTAVKVGFKEVTISAGHVAYVKCRVPENINPPEPFVLFEPTLHSAQLQRVSIGTGLMEFYKTERPFIKVPVSNHSHHNVTLPGRTLLGSIKPIVGLAETDCPRNEELTHTNISSSSPVSSQDQKLPALSLWHPPVDVSHLTDEQQEEVKQMLFEESGVFARDDGDIGNIPSL